MNLIALELYAAKSHQQHMAFVPQTFDTRAPNGGRINALKIESNENTFHQILSVMHY